VLDKGQVVEAGKTADVLEKPTQKYTKKLLMSQQFQLFTR
jgi:ABC-type microcin C transport system duplicated ATPase subunit YejF